MDANFYLANHAIFKTWSCSNLNCVHDTFMMKMNDISMVTEKKKIEIKTDYYYY